MLASICLPPRSPRVLLDMSSLNTVQISICGESPLICHNGQTADPRNTYAKALKAISSKRKKTDSDHDEMARIEWLAGLYQFGNDLVLPDFVLEASLINGAKKSKRGPQVKCGLFVTKHASLRFPGKPETIDKKTLGELFSKGENTHSCLVRVGTSRVVRTRPIFREWSAEAVLHFDPDVLNFRDVEEIVADAGRLVGVGDMRPKFGRFSAGIQEV